MHADSLQTLFNKMLLYIAAEKRWQGTSIKICMQQNRCCTSAEIADARGEKINFKFPRPFWKQSFSTVVKTLRNVFWNRSFRQVEQLKLTAEILCQRYLHRGRKDQNPPTEKRCFPIRPCRHRNQTQHKTGARCYLKPGTSPARGLPKPCFMKYSSCKPPTLSCSEQNSAAYWRIVNKSIQNKWQVRPQDKLTENESLIPWFKIT